MGGDCPFGRGCVRDSVTCRKCEYYYRAGTGTFFWCNHPIVRKTNENVPKPAVSVLKPGGNVPEKRKRGRPAKNDVFKPVKTRKPKKR